MDDIKADIARIATDVRWLRERAEEDRERAEELYERAAASVAAVGDRVDKIERGRLRERAWAAGAGGLAAAVMTALRVLLH